MNIVVGRDKLDMARRAADAAAGKIREAIAARGEARIIVATGASQFEFLAALVAEPGRSSAAFRKSPLKGDPVTRPA